MLECYTPCDWEDSALLGGFLLPGRFESMRRGQRLKQQPKEPIEVELDPNHCDKLLEFDNTNGLVMTKRLLSALYDSGVDNLDVYQFLIRHPVTGFMTQDYVIANVIGVVQTADLGNSNVVGSSPGSLIDTDFDGLTIEEDRSHNLLMFRLAENTSAVMIHEKVKDDLLDNGFDMLDFIPPEEWVG